MVALTVSLSAFAGKVDIAESDNKITVPNVISLSAEWIKDKGKKYDIHFKMHNEHSKPIVVLLSEMTCYRGGMLGELAHTFFNTGERTIDFGAGQLKAFNLVCKIGEKGGKNGGEYSIKLANVYENPSGDGKTLGKVLKTNVEWKVRIAQ